MPNRFPTFSIAAATAVAMLACGPAAARQTMVGKWAVGGKCGAPLSVIVIEPLALSGEDFYCEFANVKRTGDTVNWRGKCNFSENGYEPASVTVRLAGSRLRYRFAGMGWNGPFERCPK